MDEWGTGHLSGALPGLSHDSPAHPVLPPPQFVLENSSREDKHECPFGRSAIELTKMLCEILQVGELRKCTAPLHARSLCSGPGKTRECSVKCLCDWTVFLGFFFFNH